MENGNVSIIRNVNAPRMTKNEIIVLGKSSSRPGKNLKHV
jgi:hypothetical protein